jgi:hypothetical protein
MKPLYLQLDNNINISVREDGYINATQLCKAGNKRLDNYKESPRNIDFMNLLSIESGIPVNKLYISIIGGTKPGTWIHPLLATYFAQWISSKFAVKVSLWIEEWKKYNNNKKIYETEINNLKPDNNEYFFKEKQIQDNLSIELNGKKEVKTSSGYIDILTNDEIIEIKNGKSWKHAVGQILIYALEYPNHKKRIHLFNILPDKDIDNKCSQYNINVSYEKH